MTGLWLGTAILHALSRSMLKVTCQLIPVMAGLFQALWYDCGKLWINSHNWHLPRVKILSASSSCPRKHDCGSPEY